jgi:hypothetical protein
MIHLTSFCHQYNRQSKLALAPFVLKDSFAFTNGITFQKHITNGGNTLKVQLLECSFKISNCVFCICGLLVIWMNSRTY